MRLVRFSVMTLAGLLLVAGACAEFGVAPLPSADAGAADGDAMTDGDAAAPASCDVLGRVMTSFDDGTFAPFLDGTTSDGGGLASFDGGVRASVPAGDGTRAFLSRTFPLGGKRFGSGRLRFTLRDFRQGPSYAELGCSLRLARGGTSTIIRVELAGTSLSIDEGIFADGGDVASGTGLSLGSVGDVPASRLFDLELHAIDGGVVTRAQVDSNPSQDRTSKILEEPDSLEVRCGINYMRSVTPVALVVDDVDLELCALRDP